MLCSFCGNPCGDHACNTLDTIANEYGTDHDSVYEIIEEHNKRIGVHYRSLAEISKKELNEVIQEAKEKFPHGVHNNTNW